VYHKVRISLCDQIIRDVLCLHAGLAAVSEQLQEEYPNTLVPCPSTWDVRLTKVGTLKSAWRKDLPASGRHEALAQFLPRFMWQATALREGDPMFDVLFDATDAPDGIAEPVLVPYDVPTARLLQEDVQQNVEQAPEGGLLAWFAEHPLP